MGPEANALLRPKTRRDETACIQVDMTLRQIAGASCVIAGGDTIDVTVRLSYLSHSDSGLPRLTSVS
jgi:hypothetical protein